jgi:hypothetical protein
MYEANPQPTSQARGGARGREEAGNEGRSRFDPPPTFGGAAVDRILTPEIRSYLDDPPPSAAGLEVDYERHLAWYILVFKPWATAEECRRIQFAADLLWDLERDRQSLTRRLPAFLIPRHRRVGPPPSPPLTTEERGELTRSIVRKLKIAAKAERAARRQQEEAQAAEELRSEAAAGKQAEPPADFRSPAAQAPPHHEGHPTGNRPGDDATSTQH